ncbi:MAG: hypothetical protein ACJ72D_20240 [Marmoricola sp.]
MAGRSKVPSDGSALSRGYRRVIRRTNETGLAGRGDYEVAFGATAGEQREAWVAPAGYLSVLKERGVELGAVGAVAAFRPDEDLPEEVVSKLEQVNEVVEATPAQILHMREQGGSRAGEFGVQERMDCGITMVIVGDTQASRVRLDAWTGDEVEGWTLSRSAQIAAERYGMSKQDYISMATDPAIGLPPVDSSQVLDAHARDEADGHLVPGVWISFASLAELVA